MKYISKYGGLPMKILIKELYYGRLPAFGEINLRTEEYTNKVKNLLEAEKAILDKFPECEPLLEEYSELNSQISEMLEYHQFLTGFRAGAQIMAGMLGVME
jgi:hypothetical protein